MCSSDFELQAYFDTETGEIILVPYEPDGETVYDLEAISRLHAWEQEMAEDIKAIYENEGSPETLERSAMAGQFFESWVFSEIYKSYLNAGRRPPVFYYRDKDQKEIDLLLLQDGTLYPIEIKKSASPGKAAIKHFKALEPATKPERHGEPEQYRLAIGTGAVICFARDLLPIDENNWAVPAWLI